MQNGEAPVAGRVLLKRCGERPGAGLGHPIRHVGARGVAERLRRAVVRHLDRKLVELDAERLELPAEEGYLLRQVEMVDGEFAPTVYALDAETRADVRREGLGLGELGERLFRAVLAHLAGHLVEELPDLPLGRVRQQPPSGQRGDRQ